MDDRTFRLPRRLPAALAALLMLAACVAAPGAASARGDDAAAGTAAVSPAARWPIGGSTLGTAMAIATDHWGFAPCRGRVTLRWAALDPALNAQSTWSNDGDAYRQPSRNRDCAIALSTSVAWDWPMLCTVVVHEVGHLTGHDHVDDPQDVMYFTYVEPDYTCATTPEPLETGPPARATPAPAAAQRAAAKAAAPTAAPKSTRAPAHAKAQPKRRKAAPRRHR